MALGNVIGSNIFNILMVLVLRQQFHRLHFDRNIIDIAVLIVFSVIGWIMAWTKRELNRKERYYHVTSLCSVCCCTFV